MEKEITQGQIWEVVTETFFTSGIDDKHRRPTKLAKGEKIEIRYPYAWHFRTEDGFYLHATPEMIIENCKLFGVIWEKVRWQNCAKLKEILSLRLYEPALPKSEQNPERSVATDDDSSTKADKQK